MKANIEIQNIYKNENREYYSIHIIPKNVTIEILWTQAQKFLSKSQIKRIKIGQKFYVKDIDKIPSFTVNSWLPIFPGFYETHFQYDNEEMDIEHINEIRQEKGLRDIEFEDLEYDYRDYENQVSLYCCDYIEKELKEHGFIESILFQELCSPQYYNYSTDSINCQYQLTESNKQKIRSFVHGNLEKFLEYLKNKYTGCDGYIPYFSNDFQQWLTWIEQDQYTLDEIFEHRHKFGSLLQFIISTLNDSDNDYYANDDSDDISSINMYYYVCEDNSPECPITNYDRLVDEKDDEYGLTDEQRDIVDKDEKRLEMYKEIKGYYPKGFENGEMPIDYIKNVA